MAVDSFGGMMYNITHYKKDSRYDGIYNRFVKGIEKWSQDGKIPACVNRNLKYSFEMINDRRKANGLQVVTEYERNDQPAKGAVEYSGRQYKQTMCYETMHVQKTVMYQDREIRKKKDYISLYTNVTDVNNIQGMKEIAYNCPNCGSVMKVKELEQGCRYCGTRFMMPELFPVVTSYYTLSMPDSNNLKKQYKLSIAVGIGLAEIMILLALLKEFVQHSLAANILAFVFGMAGGAFMGALMASILFGFVKLFQIFLEAGKSVVLLSNVSGSKKKLEREMKKVESHFLYEYFESKILSMLTMLLFCESPQILTIYQGKDNLAECQSIVDTLYKGAMGLRSFKNNNGILQVQMEVYLRNGRWERDTYKEKDESYRITVEKKVQPQPKEGFEITKVTCLHCGGSFDAMKIRKCPYCNSDYHLIEDDWVVTELKKAR